MTANKRVAVRIPPAAVQMEATWIIRASRASIGNKLTTEAG